MTENRAVLYEPRKLVETLPAAPIPSSKCVQRLHEDGVEPIELGRVIISTWTPRHTTTLEIIQRLGPELHIIFNQAAVIIVPAVREPRLNSASHTLLM